MGIENMRWWPMYIVFPICILLTLSLFNSWTMKTELRNQVSEISTQLQESSRQLHEGYKQQTSCMENSQILLVEKLKLASNLIELNKQHVRLGYSITDFKNKASDAELQVNRTVVDVELCKTELQSLKNLQLSKSATLETLRLEKDTLTAKLVVRKDKIEELEREISLLKSALTTKSPPNMAPSKVTPAVEPPKLSPALNVHNPVNDPIIENNAQEELEDNLLNDGNDFDQQLK